MRGYRALTIRSLVNHKLTGHLRGFQNDEQQRPHQHRRSHRAAEPQRDQRPPGRCPGPDQHGLKVQGAKDNAAIWAIAQSQRADVGALSAVKSSLDRATSIADVALSAGESVSDLLNQLKEKVVAAKDSAR
jgi:uncharacterized membrane protein